MAVQRIAACERTRIPTCDPWFHVSLNSLRIEAQPYLLGACLNIAARRWRSADVWAREGGLVLKRSRAAGTLMVTGPRHDGFFVRCLTVLAHATWAIHNGLGVRVAFRSSADPYLNTSVGDLDGWTQFFEPIAYEARRTFEATGPTPRMEADPVAPTLAADIERKAGHTRLVSLDCRASARAWEAYGNYAPSFGAAIAQRAHRAAL